MSEERANRFKGVGVAIVTPFNADKSIDFDGLGRVLDHTVNGGVNYIVALGSTGEAATLSADEKKEVLSFCISHLDGRVPLVAGFGGNNTAALVEEIKGQNFEGIDAILSSSPHYNKPSQNGIIAHYDALVEASPVPIIMYNVPGRTASNMTAETTTHLASKHSDLFMIKEASGDIEQGMNIIKTRPDNFLVVSGEDMLTLPMLGANFDGVISVVANATPEPFSKMVRAGLAGDFDTARKLHYPLMSLIDAIFMDGNPGGIKAALHILGIIENEVRLPLVPVNKEVYKKIEAALKLV